MSRIPSLLFMVGLAALLLTACGSQSSTSGVRTQQPTTTLFRSTPAGTFIYGAEVNRAEQKWLSHKISSYRLVLLFYEYRGDKSQREVIVKEGKVISSACERGKCPGGVFINVLTIDDLFGVARGSSLESLIAIGIGSFDSCIKSKIYDDTYGFPKSLAFGCPNTYDMDHSLQVISFEVLKDEPDPTER